jgi:hypothetical protein
MSAWNPLLSADPIDTDKLVRRVLRFVQFNVDRYIQHRDQGHYHLAIQRLLRLRKLIAVVELAKHRGATIAPFDVANIILVGRHIDAMLV